MRTAIASLLTATFVVLAAPPSSSADESPCAGVECSGHGKCVAKGGEPVCACAAGYVADQATGLSCVAEPSPAPPPAAPVATTPRTSRPADAQCMNDGECQYPHVCFAGQCISKHARRTIETEASNILVPGLVITVLSVGMVVSGLVLYSTVEERETGFFLALPVGGGLGAIGLPLFGVGLHKKRRLRRGDDPLEVVIERRRPRLSPTLMASASTGGLGLAGSF